MQFLQNRHILLACLCGGALCLLAGYYSSAPAAFAFSSLCFLLCIVLWRWGYFLGPLLTGAAGTWIKLGTYELSPSQDVLIKKSEDGYYASMFLSIQLRDSASFKSSDQKALLMQMFENTVSSIRHTLKISLVVCSLNLFDYLQKLQERRSLAEHRLSQAKPNSQDFALLEREIQSYNLQIKALSGGETPMQVLAYAQTTAFGLTRQEAILRARSQAKESAAVISNSLSTNVAPICGAELLSCFEWEKISPTSKSEIDDQLL
ncbi:MAG: hypothetical protein WC492_00020 [Candidatus Micrarchaeia archaeon]